MVRDNPIRESPVFRILFGKPRIEKAKT